MSSTTDPSLLLVDDDPDFLIVLQDLLPFHLGKLKIDTATSGTEALALMRLNHYDAVLSDVRMPDMDGLALLKIQPTRAETGYGYIETGDQIDPELSQVRRFTEKPNQAKADEFFAAGNYYWNSGIFVWSARTLTRALREHFSETAPLLEKIAAAWGSRDFDAVFADLYPRCENISIDYAVLEPRSAKGQHSSNLLCLRADFGWNDLGSWAALYEHHALHGTTENHNVVESKDLYAMNATGNYIYAPGKFVAAVGVDNLVVVETDDAILVTTREHSQDVGKIVKYLNEKKMTELV